MIDERSQEICAHFAKAWERELRPESGNHALAVCFANIKAGHARQTGLWEIAIAVNYLVEQYGGRRQVAEALGVSYETIREYHLLMELPPLIKMMLR